MNSVKKLGILGGMGPYASCDWYKKTLDLCHSKFNINQDYEYPEINIVTVNMVGWSERGIEDFESVKACLMKGIDKLTQLRVDYIVIACNTVHYYYDLLQQRTTVPIINMIDYCCSHLRMEGKVGVISSHTTGKNSLYSSALLKNNIREVKSSKVNQVDIDLAILFCQRGEFDKANKIIVHIIELLEEEGADAVILGCTELPLAVNQKHSNTLIIDPGYFLLNHVTDLLYENVPVLDY